MIALLIFIPVAVCRSAEDVDFNRDIRPILSENCFHCHGPDAERREGELRLDEKGGALSAIEVGDRDQSALYLRVSTADQDQRMPPVDSNRQLTKQQIELLGLWIEQGAQWGTHWSWTPLSAPAIPQITGSTDVPILNPIDAFIRKKLDAENLPVSPEASKRTLIRRVSLDLNGLPPSPAEVAGFVQDDSPDAYERLVDRLLASPAYGERMAWDWLDAARYADSNGYQGDLERTMWPWRDWVVDAFNSNLSYDQFTIWQLAGDLLPAATFEQKLATGFCRNHMINGEGGRIAEENRVDYVMDMAETTGTLWLGLTFNCCRCHDHKFDALTQKDYYSLFAFFNQTPVTGAGRSPQTAPILAAPSPAQEAQITQLEAVVKGSKQAVAKRAEELKSQLTTWEQTKLAALKDQVTWETLQATSVEAKFQQLEQLNDGSIFATGPNPANDTYTVHARPTLQTLTALRIDVLQHDSHTKGGLARSNSGNFVLTEIEVLTKNGDVETPVEITNAEATFEQGDLKVTNAFDRKPNTGWAVYDGKPLERSHSAVLTFAKPVELTPITELKVVLRHDSAHASHNIGRFLLSVTEVKNPSLAEDQNQPLQLALHTPVEQRTKDQLKTIEAAQQADDSEYQEIFQKLTGDESRLQSAKGKVPQVMVMQDQAEFRKSFLLNRGLYTAPGDEVTAAVPVSLPDLPAEVSNNRLGLAKWLVSDDNPLMARVVVNRFWQQLFGIGLVKTANNLGVQGEIPSHEDLLNWLAADFRASGWDVKRFIKQCVMSQTYRQTSHVTAELIERDPENRLLARAPRYRLPSWMIRDQALAVSGLLNPELGGPSVNVYQPPGVWEEATFGNKAYIQDHGAALYRRSLYVFWRRIIGPTIFFDNATRQTCTVNSYRTNTPLHALLTLNDVTYIEAARVLAEKTLHLETLDDQARLNWIVQRALARSFSDNESKIMLAGLEGSRKTFAQNPASATELLSLGESPRDETLNASEHASWTALCLAVLNLDETLTKE